MSIRNPRRTAALTVAGTMVLATMLSAAPVGAATTGTVTVTGGSASKIVLTIPTGLDELDLGDNLTPDGDDSNASGVNDWVDGANPSTGACYDVGGGVKVRSNKRYDLAVKSSIISSYLSFSTAAPTSFATCTGGLPFNSAMTTGSGVEWQDDLARTSGTTTSFWLGFAVLWATDPASTMADSTLTLTATVHS